MHLSEIYASNYRLDIDKPFVYENFYPFGEHEYVTLHLGNEEGNPFYIYWQEVINLMFPVLRERNLGMLLVNPKSKINYQNCSAIQGEIKVNELAFILKSSKIHISETGVDLDIASSYNKKIAFLDNSNNPEKHRPYWNDRKNGASYICLNDLLEKDEKINKLKPERVAQSILSLIDAKHNFEFETVFVGENFLVKNIQFIPEKDMEFDNPFPNPVLVRMDKFFNENVLTKQLTRHKCTIITNKPINKLILQKFRQNISHIVYMIEEDDDPSFINELRKANLSAHMISQLDDEALSKKKLDYMNFGIINQITSAEKEDIEELKDRDMSSLYYLSNGITLCNFKTFKSIFDWKNKMPAEELSSPSQIIENEEFWKEINGLYILNKKVD